MFATMGDSAILDVPEASAKLSSNTPLMRLASFTNWSRAAVVQPSVRLRMKSSEDVGSTGMPGSGMSVNSPLFWAKKIAAAIRIKTTIKAGNRNRFFWRITMGTPLVALTGAGGIQQLNVSPQD